MLLEKIFSKDFLKLIKTREFLYCNSIFPIMAVVYGVLKYNEKLHHYINEINTWYFVSSLIMTSFFAFIYVFDFVDKKLFNKIQGDKLKMKRQEKEWR